MKSGKLFLGVVITMASAMAFAQPNVIPVKVIVPNRPVITIKVCIPGTNTCKVIPNVVLDSGSNGLRLFSSALPTGLPSISDQSGKGLALCATFGGGMSAWGPLVTADVFLGGERALNVPLNVIDATYPGLPSDCSNPMTGPVSFSNLNGILGIATGVQLPGTGGGLPGNGFYSCAGGNCHICPDVSHWASCGEGLPAQPADFDPIKYLAADNNGWILSLPQADPNGSAKMSGTLTLGIGTRENNMPPAGIKVFPIDASGFTPVIFQGQTYHAVMDTGTPSWAFPAALNGAPLCAASGIMSMFYCPSSPMAVQTTLVSITDSAIQSTIGFQIANMNNLDFKANVAFNDMGEAALVDASYQGIFLMGLPFFMGKTVYYGLRGAQTPLGVGPFNAF